jgi:hypothetical protein
MLNLTLERIERQIRNLPVEHVYVLGPDNEILFHHTDNLPDRVKFPMRLLGALGEAIVTHNHPGGRSFSRLDVRVAVQAQLHELRVVTPTHRYSLRPPEKGWNSVAPEEFDAVIDREESLLKDRMIREIDRGALTFRLVDLTLHHRLWDRIASLGLIRYAAEK